MKNLFPLFNEAQVQATVAQYESLGGGNVTNQAILIMGECKSHSFSIIAVIEGKLNKEEMLIAIFVCPTHALLQGFKGPSWKVCSEIHLFDRY